MGPGNDHLQKTILSCFAGCFSIHFPSNRGIATPACALVRNDSVFSIHPEARYVFAEMQVAFVSVYRRTVREAGPYGIILANPLFGSAIPGRGTLPGDRISEYSERKIFP